jgi:hypothetical protein
MPCRAQTPGFGAIPRRLGKRDVMQEKKDGRLAQRKQQFQKIVHKLLCLNQLGYFLNRI